LIALSQYDTQMRVLLLLAFSTPALVPGQQAPLPFEREMQPLVQRYCLACHSAAKHTGDLNLERFTSTEEVVKHPKVWQAVVDQLSLGEMPPKAMPQPGAEERLRMLAWLRGALKQAAQARAGDAGPVVLRHLNNAEYTYTIRDLTGVPTLDPAKEFPADGAAGEGFTNTGNSLVMSPALVTKYLDAAKQVSKHAMLLPDGIRFSPHTSRRDWTDETLGNIREFYAKFTEAGGADTVTQQGIALDKNRGGALPLEKYLAASLAVLAGQSIDRVARAQGLSPKYLRLLLQLMSGVTPSPVLDGPRAKWRAGDTKGLAEEIGMWQQALWKFNSVGHIGKADGPKSWMEAVTPVVSRQDFRIKVTPPEGSGEARLYLVARDAGDGSAGDSVIWKEPRLTIPGRPPILLRDVRGLIGALTQQRERIVASTAPALNAAAGADAGPLDPAAKKAWFDYLGISGAIPIQLNHLTARIQKTGNYDFIQGWGGAKQPSVLANSSDQHVRVPGNMRAHAVALLPTSTHYAAVGWSSPEAGTLRMEAAITPAHAECGNGVAWSLELRRGGTRQRLAQGFTRGAAPVSAGPFERVAVRAGDLVSVLIGPRDGNAS